MTTINKPDKWDILWIDQAQRFAEESKDRSTKVGCVLVTADRKTFISSGWNGFPRGVRDDIDSRHERPEKYNWVIHAERNAVYNHSRHGGPGLEGAIAYLNWFPIPCSNCLGSFVQSGIRIIIGPNVPFAGVGSGTNYDVDEISRQIFEETGVTYYPVDYEPRRS
jgi:dCMP deaminase